MRKPPATAESHPHRADPRPAPSKPRRRPSPSSVARGAAVACFAFALFMIVGACFMAMDWPAPLEMSAAALSVSTLAGALAFMGFGILCLIRKEAPAANAEAAEREDPVERRLRALHLTAKELTVARLILQHRSYGDIARLCDITPRTVQFHASNIFHKAHAARRRDFEHLILDGTTDAAESASPSAGRRPSDQRQKPTSR